MCWPFNLSAGFADGYWVRILPPAGQHHLIYAADAGSIAAGFVCAGSI